jgi:NAD dependent epimerase/dehydratase family enzyme
MEGAYNAVAPQHIQNKEFMRTLAKVMNRSFLHPPVPALVFKTIFGQMSDVILKGSRVSPDKIINAGYKFTYDNLAGALKNELKS